MNSDTFRTGMSALAALAFLVLAVGSSESSSTASSSSPASSSSEKPVSTTSNKAPAKPAAKKTKEEPKASGLSAWWDSLGKKDSSKGVTTDGFYVAESKEVYFQASRLYAEGETKKLQQLMRDKKIDELKSNVNVEMLDWSERLVRFRAVGQTQELWTHGSAILRGDEIHTKWSPEALRRRRIGNGLNPWDGSNLELTQAIKESMNDPDSYQHVETTFWDMKTHLVVRTTFRGKNAFGGVVKNWVKAKCELDGKLIKILEQGP